MVSFCCVVSYIHTLLSNTVLFNLFLKLCVLISDVHHQVLSASLQKQGKNITICEISEILQ